MKNGLKPINSEFFEAKRFLSILRIASLRRKQAVVANEIAKPVELVHHLSKDFWESRFDYYVSSF